MKIQFQFLPCMLNYFNLPRSPVLWEKFLGLVPWCTRISLSEKVLGQVFNNHVNAKFFCWMHLLDVTKQMFWGILNIFTTRISLVILPTRKVHYIVPFGIIVHLQNIPSKVFRLFCGFWQIHEFFSKFQASKSRIISM